MAARAAAMPSACGGGILRAVRHKPRQQQREHGHDAAQHCVAEQHPAVQPRLAAAEEVVSGKNGDGRNGGKNVAGQLGLREGEKDDGNERPQHQKFGECVAGPVGNARLPVERGATATPPPRSGCRRSARAPRSPSTASWPAPPPPGSTRRAGRADSGRWRSAPGCARGRTRGRRWGSDAARR